LAKKVRIPKNSTGAYHKWRTSGVKRFRHGHTYGGVRAASAARVTRSIGTRRTERGESLPKALGRRIARTAIVTSIDYAILRTGRPFAGTYRAGVRGFAAGAARAAAAGAIEYSVRRVSRNITARVLSRFSGGRGGTGVGHKFYGNQYVKVGSSSRFAGHRRGGRGGSGARVRLFRGRK
jgi:hypothetical protein